MPIPGLVAVNVCSSIHPLKTEPKPPSPNTLSGRKFRVALLSSPKLKLFKLDNCKISPSLRGVGGKDAAETLLLEPLKPLPSLLTYFEFTPRQANFEYETSLLTNYKFATLTTSSKPIIGQGSKNKHQVD